jgi:ATP phosphoribosyltransferase regulatory subunit
MKTQTPQGVRDLLPETVARRHAVIHTIRSVFEAHGYQRIITPVLELYETLEKGFSPDLKGRAIQFIDRSGQRMVLRPDMTTPIARVVASRLHDAEFPLRLYYVENVFRQQKPEAGRDIEFFQIGVELIGRSGPEADNEILAISKECLTAIGLQSVEIDVGDATRQRDLPLEKKQALLNGDYVAYGELPTRETLVVKDLDYYTGMVFECYVPEVGYLLGSGGRYDTLIGKFGLEKPAVGFAFNLEMLMLALAEQHR